MKIEFDTSNASFDGSDRDIETAEILRRIARKVSEGFNSGVIYDSNGNKIGTWTFTD